MDDHSSGTPVAGRLARPTRAAGENPRGPRWARPPLFGLAPGGVCPATPVTGGAVRSYRTLSPLPIRKRIGGLLSVALSLRSPSPGVTRHRVPVEPGLSSPGPVIPAEGGHPAVYPDRDNSEMHAERKHFLVKKGNLSLLLCLCVTSAADTQRSSVPRSPIAMSGSSIGSSGFSGQLSLNSRSNVCAKSSRLEEKLSS